MLTSSVILDVVIAAIVVICVLIGKRRGLFRTLAELVSHIVAWIASSILATAISAAVAEWLRPMVETKLHGWMADIAWEGVENGWETLPAFMQEEKILEALKGTLESGLSIDMGPFIEQALQNLAYAVSFIILFILVMILLRVLINMLDIVTKLPVIHELNAFGGILAGAAKGVVLVVLLLWLARETGYLVSSDAMAKSYFVPYLQGIIPL